MNLLDVAEYLTYIATYIIIVPIGVAFYFYPNQSKALRILLAGLVCVLFVDILLLWFLASKYTFLYIFSAIDILMMAWTYSVAVGDSQAGKIIRLTGLAVVPLITLDAFWGSGLTSNGYSNTFEKAVVLVMAIYYLTQLLQNEEATDLQKEPLLWISGGVLVFNLVGLCDVFSAPMLNYSRSLYLQYYMVLCIANIFMYGCFTYAFWLGRHNSRF